MRFVFIDKGIADGLNRLVTLLGQHHRALTDMGWHDAGDSAQLGKPLWPIFHGAAGEPEACSASGVFKLPGLEFAKGIEHEPRGC